MGLDFDSLIGCPRSESQRQQVFSLGKGGGAFEALAALLGTRRRVTLTVSFDDSLPGYWNVGCQPLTTRSSSR